MKFNKQIKNILVILLSTLALSACSTAKKSGSNSGDVYTGNETIKYLASGVKDRVFFATNSSSLTTASRDTLRKQADYLRKNKSFILFFFVFSILIRGLKKFDGTSKYFFFLTNSIFFLITIFCCITEARALTQWYLLYFL
ncbi:hypothetical protein OAN67_03665 [Pelagibacteraceae bacterium]|nr:hypothetical protein [Pelagibacteraceae bacterium]